jgi:hypothetical protein
VDLSSRQQLKRQKKAAQKKAALTFGDTSVSLLS